METYGKCNKIVNGKTCGGDIVEHRINPNLDVTLIGPGQPHGYICRKCKKKYPVPPVPEELETKIMDALKGIQKERKK